MKPPAVQTAFLSAAGIVTAAAFVLPWLHVWEVSWPIPLYSANSVIAFLAYRSDKRRAERGRGRWSEASLHVLEALGGFPGAFVAQRVFRHKTRKLGFQLIFWAIVLGHAALWWWRIFGAPDPPA